MIIKSNKIPYDTLLYDNNIWEQVTSYKYLGIDIHHKLNWNYSIEKMIIGGWKTYYGLENNCKLEEVGIWDSETCGDVLFVMDVKCVDVVSLVKCGDVVSLMNREEP